MGLGRDTKQLIVFAKKHVLDRTLILAMLKFEDTIIHSEQGRSIYQNFGDAATTTLRAEKTIHRIVLEQFGFDTSDSSVKAYRTIFAHYYKSPMEFDEEVMDAVTYFRSNRCVFYTSPEIEEGDVIPNCSILQLDGKTETNVYEQLGDDFQYAFVAGFSTS